MFGGNIKKEKLKFSFKNDSSLDYSHVLSTYVKVCTGSVFVSSCGNVYFSEVVDSRNGCLYIRILRNLVSNVPHGELTHNVWLGNEDKVVVNYYDYGTHSNATTTAKRVRFQYTKMSFTAGRRLFDFALTHLLGMTVNKFSIQSVYEYVRSLNSCVIVNGVDVVAGDRLSVEQYDAFCCALYCVAYRKRWMSNRLLSEIIADEQDQRVKGEKWFFVRFWKVMQRKFQAMMKNVCAETEEERGFFRSLVSFAARIGMMFDYPALFDVDITEAIKVRSFSDVVPGIVDEYLTTPERSLVDELGKRVHEDKSDVEMTRAISEVCEKMISKYASESHDAPDDDLDLEENKIELNEPDPGPIKSSGDVRGILKLKSEDEYELVNDQRNDSVFNYPGNVAGLMKTRDVRPGQVAVKCKCKFDKVKRIDGMQGECCYLALIYAMSVDITPKLLRERLRNSKYYQVVKLNVDTLDDELTPGRWGGFGVMQLFAYEFDVDICVHDCDTQDAYRIFCGLPVTKTVHLRYTGNHYDVFEKTFLSGGASENRRFRVVVKKDDFSTVMREEAAEGVCFAHCISADMGCDKHMSAGVATVFAKVVGKPTRENLRGNMTVQEYNGSHVIITCA